MLLGDLIHQVDIRNEGSDTSDLLGVSIEKHFMPSVANVIGTDLSKYKLVSKHRFACNPMHVGRDEVLPVAMHDSDIDAIVSPAYFTFEVDLKLVLPEYLSLWMMNPEFDRRCWFATDASVRGGLSWDALCEIRISIPPIEEQKQIVDRFGAIDKRISLLNQLNDKLAACAQLLYNKHFDVGDQAWKLTEKCIGDIAEFHDSKRKPLSADERASMQGIYPYYGAVSIVDHVNSYLFDGEYVLLSEDGIKVVDENGHPALQHVQGRFWVNNHAHVLKGKSGFTEASLFTVLSNANMAPIVTGAAQPKINQANLKAFRVWIPQQDDLQQFNKQIEPLFALRLKASKEILILEETKHTLLNRLGS